MNKDLLSGQGFRDSHTPTEITPLIRGLRAAVLTTADKANWRLADLDAMRITDCNSR
jgi:hypothetical protein